jgi:hypothetical protein
MKERIAVSKRLDDEEVTFKGKGRPLEESKGWKDRMKVWLGDEKKFIWSSILR